MNFQQPICCFSVQKTFFLNVENGLIYFSGFFEEQNFQKNIFC